MDDAVAAAALWQSFQSAASGVAQLYKQGTEIRSKAFNAGCRYSLERMLKWAKDQPAELVSKQALLLALSDEISHYKSDSLNPTAEHSLETTVPEPLSVTTPSRSPSGSDVVGGTQHAGISPRPRSGSLYARRPRLSRNSLPADTPIEAESIEALFAEAVKGEPVEESSRKRTLSMDVDANGVDGLSNQLQLTLKKSRFQ